MIKSLLLSASLVAAVATFTVAGCGGSSNSNPGTGSDSGTGATGGNGNDSGGGTTPGTDGGAATDSGNGGANPPLPDGSIYPHGNQLVPNNVNLVLDGVTSDDFVIYTDQSSSTAYALSLTTGSTPISLGTVDSNNDVYVAGKAVLLGTSADQNGVGAASIWTSGAAAPAPLSTATFQGYFGASADGSHVFFFDAINAAETTAAIAVAAADGTGKTTLVGSVDVADNVCFPQLALAGTYAVAAYCEVADGGAVDAGEPDGGTNVNIGTVSTFAGPTAWTQAVIATNVQTVFSVDKGATKVVVNGAAGTEAYLIAGGSAVVIDATGEIGAVTYSPGLLSADGSHLVYTTGAQALERAATTSPASPVQLAAPGTYADVLTLSPDGNWVIGMLNAGKGNQSDLYLSSTTAAGTPTTLSSATTGGLDGDPYTADSTHVLFFTGLAKGVGTLNALLAGGTTPVAIGTSAVTDVATSAAKIVFNDSYSGTTGGADLKAVDTSTTTAPTLLVTQADPTFYMNAAKTMVVYTWSYQAGASSGLWTLAAP